MQDQQLKRWVDDMRDQVDDVIVQDADIPGAAKISKTNIKTHQYADRQYTRFARRLMARANRRQDPQAYLRRMQDEMIERARAMMPADTPSN